MALEESRDAQRRANARRAASICRGAVGIRASALAAMERSVTADADDVRVGSRGGRRTAIVGRASGRGSGMGSDDHQLILLMQRPSPHFTSWIRSFPELMPSFHLHSLNKPPFSILFYVPFIKLFGNNLRAALVGGFAVGALATLSVPAVYAMVRRLTGSADAAFCSASFFALTPSLVLFMPEFDQLFPVLSCAVIAMWASALDSDHLMPAVVVGFLLAAMTLVSYNLLVLGVFLVLQTLITLRSVGRVAQFKRIVRHASTVVLTFVTVQSLLTGVFGYRPLAVFKTAVAIQAQLLRQIPRPYPQTVLFDLTDFALGSGWIAIVVLVLYLIRHRRGMHRNTNRACRSGAVPTRRRRCPRPSARRDGSRLDLSAAASDAASRSRIGPLDVRRADDGVRRPVARDLHDRQKHAVPVSPACPSELVVT